MKTNIEMLAEKVMTSQRAHIVTVSPMEVLGSNAPRKTFVFLLLEQCCKVKKIKIFSLLSLQHTIQFTSNTCTCPVKNEHNIKQEVGDDLNVCMLQLLPEASTLPSLVVIILVKAEIEIFQIVARPHFGHIVKASYGFKGGSLSQ